MAKGFRGLGLKGSRGSGFSGFRLEGLGCFPFVKS